MGTYIGTIIGSIIAIICITYLVWDNYSSYNGVLKTIIFNLISCLCFFIFIVLSIYGLITL